MEYKIYKHTYAVRHRSDRKRPAGGCSPAGFWIAAYCAHTYLRFAVHFVPGYPFIVHEHGHIIPVSLPADDPAAFRGAGLHCRLSLPVHSTSI